jgi:hypothetical protein
MEIVLRRAATATYIRRLHIPSPSTSILLDIFRMITMFKDVRYLIVGQNDCVQSKVGNLGFEATLSALFRLPYLESLKVASFSRFPMFLLLTLENFDFVANVNNANTTVFEDSEIFHLMLYEEFYEEYSLRM